MKTALFYLSLALTMQQVYAAKETHIPYYMKNANSAYRNIIKTDSANCGNDNCGGDCNGETFPTNILQSITYLSLQQDNSAQYARQVNCGGDCKHGNCDAIEIQ